MCFVVLFIAVRCLKLKNYMFSFWFFKLVKKKKCANHVCNCKIKGKYPEMLEWIFLIFRLFKFVLNAGCSIMYEVTFINTINSASDWTLDESSSKKQVFKKITFCLEKLFLMQVSCPWISFNPPTRCLVTVQQVSFNWFLLNKRLNVLVILLDVKLSPPKHFRSSLLRYGHPAGRLVFAVWKCALLESVSREFFREHGITRLLLASHVTLRTSFYTPKASGDARN